MGSYNGGLLLQAFPRVSRAPGVNYLCILVVSDSCKWKLRVLLGGVGATPGYVHLQSQHLQVSSSGPSWDT